MISSKISEDLLCQQTEEDLIDLLSRAFEGDWKLGRNPTIQQFLDKYAQSLPEASRLELKRQLQSVLSECQSTFPRPRDTSSTIVGSTLSQERPPLFQFDLPHQFGEYELTSIVGTGGKSVVYLGTRDKSGDAFAIKITPSSFITDRRGFERELNVVSQLEHPRIIKPLVSGTVREYSYVTSKYLSAPNLRDYLEANGPFTVSQAVEIVASLADTLQYAHERGIIHRDLKPRNVLLVDNQSAKSDHADDSPTFVPIIIDFGLAKDVNSESSATLTGTFFGTPAYTSPEQAKFDTRKTSNRSDIYSLGVILYELIGYSTPFQGSVESLLNQIATTEVPSVKKRNRSIDPALANICHKCLRLDPHRRYESVGDLATDLHHWLASERVKTKAYTNNELFKLGFKKLSRHRGWLATAAILLLAINVVAVNQLSTKRDDKFRRPGAQVEIKSLDQLEKELNNPDSAALGTLIFPKRELVGEYLEKIESATRAESEQFRLDVEQLVISDERKIKMLANKIAFLASFERYDLLWQHLKPSPDPRVASYLSVTLPKIPLPPSILIERLFAESDPRTQYVLLSVLARYESDNLLITNSKFKDWIINAYELNSSAGVHALCRRLLVLENLQSTIEPIDSRLSKEGIRKDRDWYVTPSGIHMAIIRAPVKFWMGMVGVSKSNPDVEHGRYETMGRPFAISMEPISVLQYLQYSELPESLQYSDDQEPIHEAKWEDYADYCNRLTVKDQLAAADALAIELKADKQVAVNMNSRGYRLPSLYEWELFARANTITDYHFGTIETSHATDFGSPNYPFSINALGYCFTKRLELTSSQYSKTFVDEPLTSFTIAVLEKGGMRSPNSRRELWTALPASPGYPTPDSTFRISRTLSEQD